MDTEDAPEEKPTIAGRALRALRTTRPVEPAAEPAVEPAAEPLPDLPPVDLVKPVVKDDTAVAGGRHPVGLLLAALIVAAVAIVFAATALFFYLRGTQTPTNDVATSRDAVITAARIDIATLNTLDYKDVKPGLEKWLNVTTGDFHDQIAQAMDQQASVIAKAKRVTVGKVVAAAVTSFNDDGTVSVIATVDRTTTPEGGTSELARNRYRATLEKDHGVWKVADLSIVSVALS